MTPTHELSLYFFSNEDIQVSIIISFNEKGEFILEGLDCGKRVVEAWGDSDYEYGFKVSPEEVKKFYPLLNVIEGDQAGLLQAIKERFRNNHAYSQLGEFMRENDIQ